MRNRGKPTHQAESRLVRDNVRTTIIPIGCDSGLGATPLAYACAGDGSETKLAAAIERRRGSRATIPRNEWGREDTHVNRNVTMVHFGQMPPSSSGLGRSPLKAETGVRVSVEALTDLIIRFGRMAQLVRAHGSHP